MVALWAGAAVGGLVGVCLAVPLVGIMQVTHRHWREYREIEALVAAAAPPKVVPASGPAEDVLVGREDQVSPKARR